MELMLGDWETQGPSLVVRYNNTFVHNFSRICYTLERTPAGLVQMSPERGKAERVTGRLSRFQGKLTVINSRVTKLGQILV